MGRTETDWLRAAILANGGTCDDLPDNLESTLYKRLIEVCASGGGGGGGGSSVQSDWAQTDSTAASYIRNKPFGDVPTGGDTIAWDGNTDGLVSVGGIFYKVSDAVPTINDFANGAIFETIEGSMEIPADEVFEEPDGMIMVSDSFIVVSIPGLEIGGMVFAETGFYIPLDLGVWQPVLTIPNYTGFPITEKINKKYLPNVFIQDERFIYLTSGGVDESKKFLVFVNDKGELQISERYG